MPADRTSNPISGTARLGAFELAQLWADRAAWPLNGRTAYAELACMSALVEWLTRWQPIAIHSAVLAGARMEAIAGALGSSLEAAFDRWHEWALRQRDFIIDGKPGITEDEYEAVAGRFASLGIMSSERSASTRASLLSALDRPEQANETIPPVGMVGYNLNLHCKF
jgi:hypothetical protein